MLIVSWGGELHEMLDPIFLGENINSLSSAEFALSMVCVRRNTEVLAGKIATHAEEILINIKKSNHFT